MTRRKKRLHYREPKIPDGFVDWMKGYCSSFDDMPDGAWQAACEDAVRHYNRDHKTNLDPFDGWMAYVKSISEAQA